MIIRQAAAENMLKTRITRLSNKGWQELWGLQKSGKKGEKKKKRNDANHAAGVSERASPADKCAEFPEW